MEGDLRKIPGFFPTPRSVVDEMINVGGGVTPCELVLEPSAGRGDIADRLRALGANVVVVEQNPRLQSLLAEKGYDVVQADFEAYRAASVFDKVIMNPPFIHGKDMNHVMRAFELLRPGGSLVSIMNAGGEDRTPRQIDEFADWLARHDEVQVVTSKVIAPELFQSDENFRKSRVPMRLLALRKRRLHKSID